MSKEMLFLCDVYTKWLEENELPHRCASELLYGKEKTVRVNDMGDKLLTLITDLGWEYQRMSRSGQEVFDEIHQLLGTITEDEVYMEI